MVDGLKAFQGAATDTLSTPAPGTFSAAYASTTNGSVSGPTAREHAEPMEELMRSSRLPKHEPARPAEPRPLTPTPDGVTATRTDLELRARLETLERFDREPAYAEPEKLVEPVKIG